MIYCIRSVWCMTNLNAHMPQIGRLVSRLLSPLSCRAHSSPPHTMCVIDHTVPGSPSLNFSQPYGTHTRSIYAETFTLTGGGLAYLAALALGLASAPRSTITIILPAHVGHQSVPAYCLHRRRLRYRLWYYMFHRRPRRPRLSGFTLESAFPSALDILVS